MHMSKEVEFRNIPLGSGPFGGGVFTVAVSITDVLLRMQTCLGLRGDFAEIGVLEGIYIHQLYPYLNNDEVCYAIDPYFELPDLREKVRLDFQSRYGMKNQVQFLYESSLSLSPEKLIREGSPGIRFLSIDGDHSEKYVLNDLVLAQKILAVHQREVFIALVDTTDVLHRVALEAPRLRRSWPAPDPPRLSTTAPACVPAPAGGDRAGACPPSRSC